MAEYVASERTVYVFARVGDRLVRSYCACGTDSVAEWMRDRLQRQYGHAEIRTFEAGETIPNATHYAGPFPS